MFRINTKVLGFGLFAFVFCFGSTSRVKAYENQVSEPYTWTGQMSSEAEDYDLNLREQRDTLLKEVLFIITQYEKEYMYYELFLLTGDEDLANQYYTDPQIHFSFENII